MAMGTGIPRRCLAHLRSDFSATQAGAPSRVRWRAGAGWATQCATDVRITETNDETGQPRSIAIRARGTLSRSICASTWHRRRGHERPRGRFFNGVNFLQMRGQPTVSGMAGNRAIEFTAPGSAETFRGQ